MTEMNGSPPDGCVVTSVTADINLSLLVRGVVDIEAEVSKLQGKLDKTTQSLDNAVKKTEMPEYEKRVRADVREANAAKINAFESEIDALTIAISKFNALK